MDTEANSQLVVKYRVSRRPVLLSGLAGALALGPTHAALGSGHALTTEPLVFPRDHGGHNDSQTEWWYLTGALQAGSQRFGFQVTFFRSRVAATQGLKSRFAAKQLVFAHAAVTDLQRQVLLHDDRIARWDGRFEPAAAVGASAQDTDVAIRDWHLRRDTQSGGYVTQVRARDFALSLTLKVTQPLLLQGQAGLSRKGPDAAQVSRYYTQPQLGVAGELTPSGPSVAVQGTAWLDHEWSNEILHPEAVGWDWIGMNLQDGSSLTAFQLRKADGSALWSGGSSRGGATSAQARIFANGEVTFTASNEPAQRFKSKKTGANYPVHWQIRTPSGNFVVRALLADQELDGSNSTGTVYWEGLSELLDERGQVVGKGYLEMTGYAGRIRL